MSFSIFVDSALVLCISTPKAPNNESISNLGDFGCNWWLSNRIIIICQLWSLDSVFQIQWHWFIRLFTFLILCSCFSYTTFQPFLFLPTIHFSFVSLTGVYLRRPASFSYGPQCNGSIYAQELYSKLVTLHLHQQAQELIARVSSNGAAHVIPTANANASSQQQAEVETLFSLLSLLHESAFIFTLFMISPKICHDTDTFDKIKVECHFANPSSTVQMLSSRLPS